MRRDVARPVFDPRDRHELPLLIGLAPADREGSRGCPAGIEVLAVAPSDLRERPEPNVSSTIADRSGVAGRRLATAHSTPESGELGQQFFAVARLTPARAQ